MLRSTQYQMMLWRLNAALDSGNFDDLSIEAVRQQAEASSSSTYIRNTFSEYDFSFLSAKNWEEVDDLFFNINNVADSKRKFGVNRRGICLLIAFTLEALQNHSHRDS